MASPEMLVKSTKIHEESMLRPLNCTSAMQGCFPVDRRGTEQVVNRNTSSIKLRIVKKRNLLVLVLK